MIKFHPNKSDVYSFGILLWELITRDKLYPELQPIQIAYGVANNNLRPPIPQSMNKKISNIITKCWDEDPSVRPSYQEIIEKLTALQTDISKLPLNFSK